VAVAVLLAVILIIFIVGRGGSEPEDTAPVIATTEETTTVTTEETTTLITYKEPEDDPVAILTGMSSSNGILIDRKTGTVLASRGGDAVIFPASMTKIMTLIVAYEHAESLDDKFTMVAEITDPLYIAGASVAGFLIGEEITVRDMIYGLMLPSGGDGALGLAYHIAGSEAAFAELMNEKAKELGLKNTNFVNCTGLHDPNHFSTCREIAVILEYALRNDFMREVMSTYTYTTSVTPEHPEGITLYSTVLSRMEGDEPGWAMIMGGKTGYTIEAKNCLATFATICTPGEDKDSVKKREPDFILVTCGSGEKYGPVYDAIDIYKTFSEPEEEPQTGGVTDPDPDDTLRNQPEKEDGVVIYTPAPPIK